METYLHLRNRVNMNLLAKKKKSPNQEDFQIIQIYEAPAFHSHVVCVRPVGSVEGVDGINVTAPCQDVCTHTGCAPRPGPATLRTGSREGLVTTV